MKHILNLFNASVITQIIVFLVAFLVSSFSYKRILKWLMFITATRLQDCSSSIKYVIVNIVKSGFVPLLVVALLCVASFILATLDISHSILDFASFSIFCFVLLRSLSIFGGKRKSSFIIWMIMCIVVIENTVFGDKIESILSSVRLNVVDFNLSIYSILRAVSMTFALSWFVSLILNAGHRIISVKSGGSLGKTSSLQYKVFNYIVYFISTIGFLTIIGVKSSHIALVGSAVGVGIGFGLQRIAANLVSGVILLMEKNIQIGDILELEDGQIGIVKSFGVRATLITTFDGKDWIIPNETLTTKEAINYTLTNNKVRVSTSFYIVNKSDIKVAIELMRRACLMQKDIHRKDPVLCCVRDVSERGIHLMAIFWISDFIMDDVIKIKSGVYTSILDMFTEHGIDLYLDRSTGILRDTMHAVSATGSIPDSPFINTLDNEPISVASREIKNRSDKPRKYSDSPSSGWKKA